jgi:hypothetical protein
MGKLKKALRFYALPMYILIRPFQGFYNMKFNKEGRLWLALLNFFVVCVSFAFSMQYTSQLVMPRDNSSMNSFGQFVTLSAMLILFCIANWSVTSLTDGEGKLKEIIMANCYAMTPIILLFIPATLLSNILADGEAPFYVMIMNVAVFCFVLYAYVGMVTVHNFSAGKALATLVLTVLALLIIAFLMGLLLTLWQQLFTFVYSLYTEIIFRY